MKSLLYLSLLLLITGCCKSLKDQTAVPVPSSQLSATVTVSTLPILPATDNIDASMGEVVMSTPPTEQPLGILEHPEEVKVVDSTTQSRSSPVPQPVKSIDPPMSPAANMFMGIITTLGILGMLVYFCYLFTITIFAQRDLNSIDVKK